MPDARPELAAEWADERDIATVSQGSSYIAAWRCAADETHVWKAAVRKRTSRGDGCPYCSNKKILVGFNDLTTTHPEVAVEWDDERDILTVFGGSGYRAQWKCQTDPSHVWHATVSKRTGRGDRCPDCSNKRVTAGANDLATTHPSLASQLADPRLAAAVLAGSPAYVDWRCELGHVWSARIADRVTRDTGCGYCSSKRVLVGFNDLATTHPTIAAEMEDDSFTPRDVMPGSKTIVGWRCADGHVWRARVANRAQNGVGCPQCSAQSFASSFENEVADYIESLGLGIERSVRRFKGKGVAELDIFITSLGIAVECNGVYWHSEKFRDKNYHAAKRKACEALGIRLIQVWEDDWADRSPIVERLLAHKLGFSMAERVPARKTVARSVSTAEAREFLDANHIQGFTGATYHLGLENDGRLVAVMSLKRTGKPGELRLERYATSAHVLGGQSKLIRHAEREVSDWAHLITFADLEVSDGDLYEKSGWVKDGELPPDYKYRVGARREHKFNYRLKRFREDPALKYEEGMSERELAILNGLDRIWDSGKIRYRFE